MTRVIPQGEAHITELVSSKYVLQSVVFFQTVLCNRLAGPLLIVPIANSVHGGKPGTHSYKAGEKAGMSGNRWPWWLLRVERIRLDVQMKTQCSKSVEPAVCPTAWISAWKGTFLTEQTARRANLLARGARRADPGTHRSNVNQLLVHRELTMTWYQAPERQVQRGDTEGRGIFPSGCSYSGPCCLQWERGNSCGVPATPRRWACGAMTAFNQVFTVPGIGWLIYILLLVGQEGVGVATS